MPRITKMWGFEEQWPSTVWDAHGFDVSSTSNDDTNFAAWCNTSPTAGFVSGVRSLKIRHQGSWHTTGYDGDTWHENTGGAGAYASGRVACTIMPDNIGGAGLTRTLLAIYARGDRMDGGGVAWTSSSFPIGSIYVTVSGSGWLLTLYMGNTAQTTIPFTIVREQPNRIGIEYFWKDNYYYARVTANGSAITEWQDYTNSAISPPGKGIRLAGGGINNTSSTSGVTGVSYATCFDDIIYISDTITDVNVSTQAVTRAEAEPPDPSGPYYVRALDVSAIAAAAGTWTGAAGDIDIADSDNAANYVQTTDTSTAKPLRMDVDYAAVSGTAPASYLGMAVRNLESQVTMVTDLQLSEDNFANTTGVMSEGTPGASMTRREISTTVKANGGGALDKTAIEAMELGYRVTS